MFKKGKKKQRKFKEPEALGMLGLTKKQKWLIVVLGFLFIVFLLAGFTTTIENRTNFVYWGLSLASGLGICSIIIFGKKEK